MIAKKLTVILYIVPKICQFRGNISYIDTY